jgi:PAS domain S-box-containing protein
MAAEYEKRKQARGDLKDDLMKHIYEISCLLTQSPDLDKVLNEIVDHVITGLKYDRAIIMLLNDEETKLECKCIRGFTAYGEKRAWEKALILDRHDCYETKVVRSGQPLFLPDIESDPNITNIDRIIAKHQERRSFLHVPLKVKDKVLGTIGVDRYLTRMDIRQEEVEALAIFANQAAVIIENTRLYEEIKDQKLLFQNIIESSINGIIVSDLSGRIYELNPMAEEILGIKKDESINMCIEDILNVDLKDIYEKLGRKESIDHFELNYQRKDGHRLILDLNAFPIKDKTPYVSKAVILMKDLTEKRKIYDHLMRIEKFAVLGSMAAWVAHEIRNPMAAIFTTLQNIETGIDSKSPKKYALRNVMKEVDRVEKLIRELLNISISVPLNILKVDIYDLLKQTIEMVQKRDGQKNITFELKGSKMFAMADPNRLKQVFINIVINSIESISGSGEVNISLTKEKGMDGNRRLIVKFKDNGKGIHSSNMSKIFDPFFSTKSHGTGLGLTVSHKIIQEHNGLMEVESEEDKGTTVAVRLPISA